MADLRNSKDNSYYAEINNYRLSKNEMTKSLILASAVQRLLNDFGVDLSGGVVIPPVAEITSITGGAGFIEIEYTGTLSITGGAGEIILEAS